MKRGRPSGSKGFHYSMEYIESVVSDYLDNGLKLSEVLEKYHCSATSIYRWCIYLNRCELVPFGNTKVLKIKEACNFTYQQILDYSIDQNWDINDMIKNFELNETEAQKLRSFVYRNKTNGHFTYVRKPRKITKEIREKLISLCDGNHTYIDLCNATGRPYGYIAASLSVLRKQGYDIKIKYVKPGKKVQK